MLVTDPGPAKVVCTSCMDSPIAWDPFRLTANSFHVIHLHLCRLFLRPCLLAFKLALSTLFKLVSFCFSPLPFPTVTQACACHSPHPFTTSRWAGQHHQQLACTLAHIAWICRCCGRRNIFRVHTTIFRHDCCCNNTARPNAVDSNVRCQEIAQPWEKNIVACGTPGWWNVQRQACETMACGTLARATLAFGNLAFGSPSCGILACGTLCGNSACGIPTGALVAVALACGTMAGGALACGTVALGTMACRNPVCGTPTCASLFSGSLPSSLRP